MTLKRTAIFIHRWLGVALCALFLLWFPSGIGMMYWDFPSVTPADRLEHGAALDPNAIRLSPGNAYATLGLLDSPTEIRLNTFDGRPVYRFGDPDGESVVYADTGEQQTAVSDAMLLRIAAAWTRQPAADAIVTSVTKVDQWTVAGELRTLRPLWKYTWPSGDAVYVDGSTGEVVQATTRASRLGAYAGAIPHWLYFTPLRSHPVAWSRFVIWTSAVGTVAAVLGIVIGAWMYSPRQKYRYAGIPTSIPYRGQKRWHMVFGLVFGLGAATWAFSGMLSMDPFPRPTGGPNGGRQSVGAEIASALRGPVRVDAFDAKDPWAALGEIAPVEVKELELALFAAEPVYIATVAGGGSLIVPVHGTPQQAFDETRILEIVRTAAGSNAISEASVITEYDAYYLDRRRERPLPAILVRMADAAATRYYINPKTAHIVSTYSSRNWVNRWLYHGLHSLDVPWLYNHRPLWDILVITFMLGGTTLSVTSLTLAWRVLGRRLTRGESDVTVGT